MKPIRVLQRAADVLRALEARPGSALGELHAATGIPKPTLLRLLGTLEAERMVWRAMADGRYRSRVALGGPMPSEHKHFRLLEVAAPHLTALRRRVVWPSDLTVREGHVMKLIETSRRESSLAMHRDAIGFRIDMLVSAVGRAYLAFCPQAERDRILATLRANLTRANLTRANPTRADLTRADPRRADPTKQRDRPPHGALLEPRALERTLAQTRERGYGVRDLRFGGLGWRSEEDDDRLAAIAVPITSGRKVLACINIVWPRRYDTEAEIARRYLPELRKTALAIAAGVAADGAAASAAPKRPTSA